MLGARGSAMLGAFPLSSLVMARPLSTNSAEREYSAMSTLHDLADRLAIQQNLYDYADAVDLRDFDLLDRVFVPDARISYGNQIFNREQAKQWLRDSLSAPGVGGYYHLMGHVSVQLEGDSATSRTRCFNPMEFFDEDGQARLWFNGLWYHWRHVRTADGWRIAERLPPERRSYRSFGWTTPPFASEDTGPPR